jgi:hypothetical protein
MRLMRCFDFERVQQVMTSLDWRWHFDDVSRVPTVNELEETAQRLLVSLATNPEFLSAATGGFKAQRVENIFSLSFVVEEYESGS